MFRSTAEKANNVTNQHMEYHNFCFHSLKQFNVAINF